MFEHVVLIPMRVVDAWVLRRVGGCKSDELLVERRLRVQQELKGYSPAEMEKGKCK